MTTESQPIRERKVTICPMLFVSALLPFYSCPGPLYLTWGDKSSTKAHKGDLGLSVVFYLSNLQHLSSSQRWEELRRKTPLTGGGWGGSQAMRGAGEDSDLFKSAVPLTLILSSSHRSAICPQTWRACMCLPFNSSLCRKQIMKRVNTLPTGSATALCPAWKLCGSSEPALLGPASLVCLGWGGARVGDPTHRRQHGVCGGHLLL